MEFMGTMAVLYTNLTFPPNLYVSVGGDWVGCEVGWCFVVGVVGDG